MQEAATNKSENEAAWLADAILEYHSAGAAAIEVDMSVSNDSSVIPAAIGIVLSKRPTWKVADWRYNAKTKLPFFWIGCNNDGWLQVQAIFPKRDPIAQGMASPGGLRCSLLPFGTQTRLPSLQTFLKNHAGHPKKENPPSLADKPSPSTGEQEGPHPH